MVRGRQGEGRQGARPGSRDPLDSLTMATILFGLEAALKAMLRDISEHYEIPYEDLEARYLVPKEGDENSTLPDPESESEEVESKPKKVSKPKSKPKAKAKSEDEEERPKCAATTAKGAPCKNLALAGLCYCRVHQNKFGDSDDEEDKPKKKVSKPKSKSKKSKKVVDPEELIASDEEETPKKSKKAETPKAPKKAHTHKVDEEDEDCAECSSKGNPVKKLEDEFEEDEDTSKKLESLLDKLDAMGAGSDNEEDEDEEEAMYAQEDDE